MCTRRVVNFRRPLLPLLRHHRRVREPLPEAVVVGCKRTTRLTNGRYGPTKAEKRTTKNVPSSNRINYKVSNGRNYSGKKCPPERASHQRNDGINVVAPGTDGIGEKRFCFFVNVAYHRKN